ncbi:1c296539-885c-419b-8c11-1f1b056d9e2f [Sclerotinia trifoliorum]|uniref:1c296539-885c-419b-8c11-1f1b056d9e2f n=1 Tax=Sclerotinia trifoliorum TaxID=28548 RepID=A0A8H2ZNV6_9HELO|nr:1c296539-885c-419b-8c11-1f1b056d9e2f [Sclerotinia trifoliorum]
MQNKNTNTTADSEESSTKRPQTEHAALHSEAPSGASSIDSNVKDAEIASDDVGNATQAGVQNIEAVSMTWTTCSLVIAYIGIFLISFTTSLESQVVMSLSIFATSSFNNHSLISTVFVVQSVVMAVIKTPMAKTADVFGRLEAFSISIFLAVLGGLTMAISSNVQTYAAAQIFYAAGSTGLQILQQIFIADTTDLLNRALWSSLPQIPFLITVWIGAPIGDKILKTTTWRWGYAIWCIILPAVFLPLALSLFLNNRKAKKANLAAPSPLKGLGPIRLVKTLWNDLDIGGMILLSAAFALILIPLTIASKASNGWASPDIIVMIVLGVLCLFSFLVWESIKQLAPHPLIPLGLLKSRSFCAGCGIGFFYFMAFFLSVQPYFYSYLLVVQDLSIPAAGHITQVFSFTATISSVIISFFIKYTKYYKPYITAGSLIYLMGIGVMYHYRQENSSIAQIIGTQIAVGIGGGMLNVPAQLAVQTSVPSHQNVAVATAVYLTCVEMGGAVGSAIAGVIWGHDIPKKLAEYSTTINSSAVYNSINNALAYPMGSTERIAINRAYQETMHKLLVVALCVSAPIVFLSLVIKNVKVDAGEDKVKGRVIGGTVEEKQETRNN